MTVTGDLTLGGVGRVPRRDVVLGRRRPGRGGHPRRRAAWWCRSPADRRRSWPATATPPHPRPGPTAGSSSRASATTPSTSPRPGPTPGRWPQRWSRADFAWDPAISADGRWVAWHEWDLAAMSWTASRIVLVDRHVGVPGRGRRRPARVGGPAAVLARRPRARLRLGRDRLVERARVARPADGTGARPLLVEPHDHAEPAWGPGQRSFAWSPASDAIALCRNEDGFARLVVVGLDGAVTEVARGWHHGIDWGPAGIVAVRSGGRTPPQVTIADPAGGARRVVARGAPAGIEDRRTRAGDRHVARRATTPSPGCCTGPTTRPTVPPPLLVDLHGGPTGQAVVRWDGWLRYFTSRGFAVLRPNPRGSTGFGRAFVQDHARTLGRRRRRRRRRRDRGGGSGRMGRSGPGGGGRRERRRADRAARVRPPRAPRAGRGLGLRRHRPLRPRPDHPPLRVPLPRRDRRAAAGGGGRVPGALTRSPTPPRSPRRCSCCRATPIRSCRPRRRSCSSTRCAPRAGPSSTTSTRARATAGRDARRWRTSWRARGRSSNARGQR